MWEKRSSNRNYSSIPYAREIPCTIHATFADFFTALFRGPFRN